MEKSTLYLAMDEMKEILGADELLDSIALALDVDTLSDILAYIIRNWDIPNTYGLEERAR